MKVCLRWLLITVFSLNMGLHAIPTGIPYKDFNVETQATATDSVLITNKNACYLDLGVLSAQMWGFMIWYPTVKLDLTPYNQYLNSLFTQLKFSGINHIYLSFAQISSINVLLNNGVGASPSDVIAHMMIDFPGGFKALIKMAHAFGMKVDLAFGGEAGNSMTLLGPGETPQGQATKLVQFMQAYNIDGVDFDLENTLFTSSNSPANSITFFKTLFDLLSQQGKTSTLTIMGAIHDWPLGNLKYLFFDSTGALIVPKLFHKINLMLYSATQYYLDASNPTWGLQQWLDLIGKQNVNMLAIGFEDGINYTLPQSSAGGKYTLTSKDSGSAAAEIYIQILRTLRSRGYPIDFSPPFFWPDNNRHDPGTWSRYQAIVKNGKTTVQFSPQMIKAFYLKLSSTPI